MPQNKERKYLGNMKTFANGDIIAGSICLSDISPEDINEYNGKKYLRLAIGKKREPSQWGHTHAVWFDAYDPEQKSNGASQSSGSSNHSAPVDDLPF